MLKKIIILIFNLYTANINAQNYIEYQKMVNRIDEDIIANDFRTALNRFDSIYSQYDFIYAKHCIKALQISVVENDSIRADKWLNKSFKQGIPNWYINTNEITKVCLNYSTTQQTKNNYNDLHQLYKSSLDTTLVKTIADLLDVDRKLTHRINEGFIPLRYTIYYLQWKRNNKKQLKKLKQIIYAYGYPDERLIGLPLDLDSTTFADLIIFYGCNEIRNSRVQVMLQHCFTTKHKVDLKFRQALYKNLEKGYMSPFQYAIISDFMLEYFVQYHDDKYSYTKKEIDLKYIEIIDKNRMTIGLNTWEQEKRNTLINREIRKLNKANFKIMLDN